MYFPLPETFPPAVKAKFLYNYISINIKLIRIEPGPTFTRKMRKVLYE
jgi:hypothetical protein